MLGKENTSLPSTFPMNIKLIVLWMTSLFLVACASAPDFSRISMGMPKNEVVSRLGKPASQAAQGRVEYLTYGWPDSAYDGRLGGGEYMVQLTDGRVTAYGKKGDFDTTSDPIQRQQIEVRRVK
jgi:hypothetical protein